MRLTRHEAPTKSAARASFMDQLEVFVLMHGLPPQG
jgi:hypothetical protein